MIAASQRPAPVPHTRQNPPPLSSTITFSTNMAPSQPQPRTSTLKRKRPAAAASYRSETQVDSTTGRVREIIVIEDTPSPPPPALMSITPSTLSASAAVSSTYSNGVRTRAQVAAEASGSRIAMAPPAAKRRKKDSNPTPSVTGANGLPSSTGSALQRKAIAGRAYYQKPAATYTNGTTSTASRTREVCVSLPRIFFVYVISRISFVPSLKVHPRSAHHTTIRKVITLFRQEMLLDYPLDVRIILPDHPDD